MADLDWLTTSHKLHVSYPIGSACQVKSLLAYYGHLQIHKHLLIMDQLEDCLIQLAIVTHAYCHFKFTSRICNKYKSPKVKIRFLLN